MRRHCHEPIGRDDAAAAACMSPAHFSRLFRRHFGRTFTETMARIRIDRAAGLLATTERPLSLVALECGFSDQSYFTKVFRRLRGMTPLAYRRGGST